MPLSWLAPRAIATMILIWFYISSEMAQKLRYHFHIWISPFSRFDRLRATLPLDTCAILLSLLRLVPLFLSQASFCRLCFTKFRIGYWLINFISRQMHLPNELTASFRANYSFHHASRSWLIWYAHHQLICRAVPCDVLAAAHSLKFPLHIGYSP